MAQADLEPIIIPEIRGTYGQARVALIDAPFLISRSTQQITYPDADFGPMLMDEIFHRQSCFAQQTGVFRKAHVCRSCAELLETTHPEQQQFELTITYRRLQPFRLTLELPAVRCPACGTTQALGTKEIENDIAEALIVAYESRQIRP